MQITDTEVMLMNMGNRDRNYARGELAKANAEINRIWNLLQRTEAALEQAQADLADERAARVFAEYQVNRRH